MLQQNVQRVLSKGRYLINPNTCHHIPVGSRQGYDRRPELNAEWIYSSDVLICFVFFLIV